MSWALLPVWSCALLAQGKVAADAAAGRLLTPQLVLADLEPAPRLAAFGLGDGGVRVERHERQWSPNGCTSPGGVRVECLAFGVKLTFATGRELLVAPDGFVHLRSGERAGPFVGGVELRLADGDAVRVALAPGQRDPVRDVRVGQDGDWWQPWRRGAPSRDVARDAGWAADRLCCVGDGGDLFRPIALGALLVLDRVLVAGDRAAAVPAERLVLFPGPLLQALDVMHRQHREANAALRAALAAVRAVAENGENIFPVGAGLPRVESDRLRWQLAGGFEIELATDGALAPRLQLFAPRALAPMVEWTARADAAAFLTNPRDDQREQRWHGNGTRMPRVLTDLQAREERFERGNALRVIERLRR